MDTFKSGQIINQGYFKSFITLILSVNLLLSFSTELFSQNNPFIGTWKYEAGNEIFYVTFYKEGTDVIRGNYRKVIVDNNGIETQEIYRSNKFMKGTNIEWPSCFNLNFDSTNNKLGGTITDNTIDFFNYNPNRSFKSGILKMKLLSSCVGCPLAAEWKIKRGQGIQLVGEPDYNIPTNVVLIKVQ